MEDRRSGPPGLVSQDDGGLWMKMDPGPVTDHTETHSVPSGEDPQDETRVSPPAHAVLTRYYSVMDDEGTDVFTPPPPPSSIALLSPAEDSTGAKVNNSSVTRSTGASDDTEAEANPCGLDWHHGEKQLMAAQNKVDEVIASTAQTSEESMDAVSLSNNKDPTPTTDEDQTSTEGTVGLMETCHDLSGRHHQDNSTRDKESDDGGDIVIWRETDVDTDKYPKDKASKIEETSENETYDKTEPEDVCGLTETDLKQVKQNVDCDRVGTNVPTLPGLSVKDDDLESSGPPELCEHNETGSATNQPPVPESPAEVTNEDHEEHVDATSLNYKLTKNDWARRESSTGEAEVPQHLIFEGSGGTMTKGELGDGSKRIATDIQQGEQLLQRLQLVQQRQDVHMSGVEQETRGKKLGVCETKVDDLTGGEVNLTDGTEVKESRVPTVMDEGVKMNMMEKETNEENESEDSEKASTSLSTMPEHSKDQRITRTEDDNSDEDQSDSWVQDDLSPINPHETPQTPSLSAAQHRLSAAGTSMERQIQEANQAKQNLQRAGGIFNLADNPDVLEIPFKTNISLEPLPSQVGQGQRSDWQFSEQKMQKEISQEIQRELVLVNQGKIPGVYSKGEVRQLKETKLLFEAFQQDNTEGPTRIRKLPNTLIRHHLYPSVLERTRSLETISLKSCPLPRAHSLRLYESATSEGEKSTENPRSTGGARDKTRLSPYQKQDKHPRLCRSMDSVSADASTSAVERRSKSREGNERQESPVLQRNPFFKLRPALSQQPEVEKDIREAKEREEELRRQRCTLYGEDRQSSQEEEKSRFTKTHVPDARQQSRGKLERIWPPPSMKDQLKSEQTQWEAKVHRAGGQKAPLWQRWESGQINGQPPKEKD